MVWDVSWEKKSNNFVGLWEAIELVSVQVLTAFLYDKCESRKFLHTVMTQ